VNIAISQLTAQLGKGEGGMDNKVKFLRKKFRFFILFRQESKLFTENFSKFCYAADPPSEFTPQVWLDRYLTSDYFW
jgi:hypothetical protein